MSKISAWIERTCPKGQCEAALGLADENGREFSIRCAQGREHAGLHSVMGEIIPWYSATWQVQWTNVEDKR
jgi:hypothetical protein